MKNKIIDEIMEASNLLKLADRLEMFYDQLEPSN